MCIIIVNQEGKLIKDELLIKSATINPHGLGVTWLDTYETEYSLSSDWEHLRVERPYIAHFRYATIGKVCKENTHPFEIGDTGCLLYQNGSVLNLGSTFKTDAQHMADILADTNPEHWGDILEMSDCRWVVVDTINKTVDLYNEEMFLERDGMQFSKANVLDGELVAVYGTLKQGYSNNRVMGTSKFIGRGRTANLYPMVGHGVPFVLPEKGIGHNVSVEVFMTTKEQLEGPIDRLEGHPNWYNRKKTTIIMEDGKWLECWLYFNPTHKSTDYEPEEFMEEFVSPYRQSNQWKFDNWDDTNDSPKDAGLDVWHSDPDKPEYSDDLSGAVCDKCGFFDTIFDDLNDELFCNHCNNYTTSEDIVEVDKPF